MALMPVKSYHGIARVRPYLMLTSTTLYEGQLVELTSSGNVIAHSDGATNARIAGVVAATTSCTSTTVPVMVPVYDDPMQVFRVPTSAAVTVLQINNAFPTSGNANTVGSLGLISAAKLNAGTLTGTSDALKMVGVPAGGLNAVSATGLNSAWNAIPGMSYSSTNPGTVTSTTAFYEAFVQILPSLHAGNVAAAV